MTQTVPATCVLGPGKTGLTIGYRVLNLDGTQYSAFSTTGVAETSTAGTYRVAGGVVCPAAGGYIVWGEAATDYAEATVESTAVNVTYSAGVALSGRLAEYADLPAAAPTAAAIRTEMDSNSTKLANLDATVSSRLAASGYTAPLDAAGVRTAVGLATANLDTQLATIAGYIDTEVAAILEDTGTTLPGLLAVGVGPGSSTGYYTDTIDNGTNPLDGVRVQLYTAPNRVGPAYEAYTNALGVFEMWPDPGVYYRWLDLAGYNFSQDVAVTVTEP